MSSPQPQGRVSESIIRVRYAETDAMGIVHHSNYVIWFELGRIAWMDAVGVPYAEVAAGGNHFAVTGLCLGWLSTMVLFRSPFGLIDPMALAFAASGIAARDREVAVRGQAWIIVETVRGEHLAEAALPIGLVQRSR